MNMAFAARLGPLTAELVEAVTLTSTQSDPDKFKKHHESAIRSLRSHSYLRTNQFEVEKSLDGLEERFRVNDRDALADALEERRFTLRDTPSKWHPEILFLLLELSDQPTFNSKLSDLDLLRPDLDDPEPALRWEDIAKEDGWDEDAAIWKSIKYGDSSDDEYYGEDLESGSEASSVSSHEPAVGRTATDFIIHTADIEGAELCSTSQDWRLGPDQKLPTDSSGKVRKVPVTEFHAVREVLFMLQGFKTTLFEEDGSISPYYQISHIAWETNQALLHYFSEAGRQVGILRRFAATKQTSAHLQVFHDSVASQLDSFDRSVSEIQRLIANPKEDIAVSLLSVKGTLAQELEPLYILSGIVDQILDKPKAGAFRHLELLFDETSTAQLCGRSDVQEFLARIFVECFNVYLRPIRLWMEEGRLLPNDKIFFVSESPTRVPLGRIWRDQFKLRRTADGHLHAPKFLQPAATKIFNAGKNIVALKHLGQLDAESSGIDIREPSLWYEELRPAGLELAPFPDLFDAVFERWIQSRYTTTSETLKNTLFETSGLWKALDALGNLYFMSDGSATEMFSNNLFGKLDALSVRWTNRYALTSMAQEAFSPLLDSTRLSITVAPEGHRLKGTASRDSVRTALPTIRVNYRLAWPVQMIISEDSVAHYHSVFTLMLQLRRALHVLHKQRLRENYWTDDENWDERALYYAVRTNLVWFCTTIQTYFATLVLAPNSAKVRQDLAEASDVDAMITIHTAFMKRIVDEACLGSRLTPIRECILDILDLAIKLEQAQSSNAEKEAEEMQELSRLSVISSSPAKGGTPAAKRTKYVRDSDDEDSDEERPSVRLDKPYAVVLREIKSDFDRHLRFIGGGLRSVARATSGAQSAKWDILAEMLQTGSRDRI